MTSKQENPELAALEVRVAALERLVADLAAGEIPLRRLKFADAEGRERIVHAVERAGGGWRYVVRDLHGDWIEEHGLGSTPDERAAQSAQAAIDRERQQAIEAVETAAANLPFSVHALRESMDVYRQAWPTGAARVRDDAAKLGEVLRALREMVERVPWPAGTEAVERFAARLADAETLVALHDQRLAEDEAARRPRLRPTGTEGGE